jgi:hypothetical protein
MPTKNDFRQEYEELRAHFKTMSPEEIRSGNWFAGLIRWMLVNYAKNVDANYIRRKYPAAGPINQSKKAIKLARSYAALVGGVSAAGVTALELSIPGSGGLSAAIAVPSMGASIIADVAMTTRIQLRATYDLSVIHRAPLSMDDAEDCVFIFMTAMGVRLVETAGDVAKAVGPKIVAYNVRKLLRTGLRKAIQEILKKIIGTQLARKLTERAMMRVFVPGVSIPISATMNGVFTNSLLKTANKAMLRRGAVVVPLVRLFQEAPDMPREVVIKALIAVMESPEREGWSEGQLNALRHTQSALALSDEKIGELEDWFDRDPEDVLPDLPIVSPKARAALEDYMSTVAALDSGKKYTDHYAGAISTISRHLGGEFTPSRIEEIRKKLS